MSLFYALAFLARSKRSGLSRIGLLVLAAALLRSGDAIAAGEGAPPMLPDGVNRFLTWLPADTETIVVARSFVVEDPKENPKPDWGMARGMSLIAGRLGETPGALLFPGRRIKLAMMGGRHFETVSAFGSLRYEGCSVIEFDDPWMGDDLLDSLRRQAEKVCRMGAQEVFVFPDQTVMEPAFKQKAWQGLFIAIVTPAIALCASSDAYLDEVLKRMTEEKPQPRAMSPDLSEWKYVDPQSPCWAIRHIPRGAVEPQVAGLAWVLRPHSREVFEVTYVPTPNGDARELANKLWRPAAMRVRPRIESKDGQTAVVTIDISQENISPWYAFPIYWVQGFSEPVGR